MKYLLLCELRVGRFTSFQRVNIQTGICLSEAVGRKQTGEVGNSYHSGAVTRKLYLLGGLEEQEKILRFGMVFVIPISH